MPCQYCAALRHAVRSGTLNTMSEKPADQSDDNHAPVVPPSPERPSPVRGPDQGKRLDPTRYGDWEKNGRCIDF